MALTPEQRQAILADMSSQQGIQTPAAPVGSLEERINQSIIAKTAKERNVEAATPKKEGFWSSLAKDMVKSAAEMGVTGYNILKQTGATGLAALRGESEVTNEMKSSRNLPWLGETKPAFTGYESTGEAAKKMAGYGAEGASWFVGGGGAKNVVQKGLKGLVKQAGLPKKEVQQKTSWLVD
jgi:hypothetical protein